MDFSSNIVPKTEFVNLLVTNGRRSAVARGPISGLSQFAPGQDGRAESLRVRHYGVVDLRRWAVNVRDAKGHVEASDGYSIR